MRSAYELIYNPRNIEFEPEIAQIIEQELAKINQEDLTGLCKFLATNIKQSLAEKGINSEILDFNQIADVNHVALISKDGKNTFLIDPSYSQFCQKEGYQMINNQQFFDQKLKNPQIAEELKSKGYLKISQADFEDYLNSFI